MAKTKTVYVCSNCGYESAKWNGRCSQCGEWNTMEETEIVKTTSNSKKVSAKTVSVTKISEISTEEDARYNTGMSELDRVLGGGIVNNKVLENCNIDSSEYSGLAFGIGIERIAMLKYGINHMGKLFENDIEFLKQFKA
mgnify:CR=1 FL=1